MPRFSPLLLVSLLVPVWLAASYGLRFSLMEDASWVALCVEQPADVGCRLRDLFGLLIHLSVLAWLALVCAALAYCLPGRAGWWMACLALFFGVPALVLYTTSLASLALVAAALRLVRRPCAQLSHV